MPAAYVWLLQRGINALLAPTPPATPHPPRKPAGAAFGKGIYFSSELHVAFAFCQPGDGWASSGLGRGGRLRCLLVCSVEAEHVQGAHNTGGAVSTRALAPRRLASACLRTVLCMNTRENSKPKCVQLPPPSSPLLPR